MFSFKGIQSRKLPAKKLAFDGEELKELDFQRKYRGNFIKYAYRSSDILEAPEIRRQVRRHMIVLKKYMNHHNFDNSPKIDKPEIR